MKKAQTFTIAQCAPIIGKSRVTLHEWINAGCPRNKDGTLSIADIFTWRIARVEADAQRKIDAAKDRSGNVDTDSLDKLRAEKMKRDISLKDFDLKEKLSEMIPVSEHTRILTARGSTWAQITAQIPRWAPDFVGIASLELARERLISLATKINDAWKQYNGTKDGTSGV